MDKHIRVLGWIYIGLCGLALALGLALCVGLGLDPDVRSQTALQYVGPPFLLVACLGLIPGLVGGIGLLRSRPWARVLLLFCSAILLPLLPVGSVLALYGFWTLLNPETKALIAGAAPVTSPSRWRASSPFLSLLGVMACVAAAFFLALKIGFIIHHDPQPAPINSGAWTATAVLVLVVGAVSATLLAIHSVRQALSSAHLRKTFQKLVSDQARARHQRAEELAADPARARYAPLVEHGEDWSDEQIAYHENPEITVTCIHLQPIERAMRGEGINVRWFSETSVTAQCRVDFDRLDRAFHTAPPVRYAEFFRGDPDYHEYPAAYLSCETHRSIIHTVHPEEGRAQDAPWFPAQDSYDG